jgi:DNA-binding NtrC family response regulator
MQIGVETSKAVDQRRVFVVDEDEVTRAVLQFMLHDEIETHELVSPDDAFEKGQDWLKPDLVLLGISWIQNNGMDVLNAFNKAYPGVRILIVCGKDEEKLAVEAMQAGAHGAIVKPLTIEAVRKKVDTVLGRGGGAPLVQLNII